MTNCLYKKEKCLQPPYFLYEIKKVCPAKSYANLQYEVNDNIESSVFTLGLQGTSKTLITNCQK